MAVSLDDVTKGLSPERQKRIQEGMAKELAEYESLQALRKELGLTQVEIAGKLDIKQNNISDLEARSDIKLSTLRSYLNAMGGELVVSVKFPDKDPRVIESLSQL